MRPIHRNLAAAGLLAVCLFLGIRPSVQKTPELKNFPNSGSTAIFSAETLKIRKRDQPFQESPHLTASTASPLSLLIPKNAVKTSGVSNQEGPSFPIPHSHHLRGNPSDSVNQEGSSSPIPRSLNSVAKETTSPSASPPDSYSDGHPRAIQLADNVQLPAAIMAQGTQNNETTSQISLTLAAAIQGIVNSFYQELAVKAAIKIPAAEPVEGGDNAFPGNVDEETFIITPGLAVDEVRTYANDIYRALFGQDAYNRQTMNATLESQLPSESSMGHE